MGASSSEEPHLTPASAVVESARVTRADLIDTMLTRVGGGVKGMMEGNSWRIGDRTWQGDSVPFK